MNRTQIVTLGELITRLRRKPQDADIAFDFCRFRPLSFHSYRGYYEDLAIDYTREAGKGFAKVADFVKGLDDCLGRTFIGYKGGSYDMQRGTYVWVADYGDCFGTAITDIAGDDGLVVLVTSYVE